MRTLVGMISNQQPFLPKYTQQVVKAQFEYFNYAGANWGIMFKGEANEFGSSSNVSDKFSFGEHMEAVPNNDRDKVYVWNSHTSPAFQEHLNQDGIPIIKDIYMIRLNSYFSGSVFQVGNESSYALGSDFSPDLRAIFGEIEFKHGKLLRERIEVGTGKFHIGPTPEGERPTISSYDTTYRIVPRNTLGTNDDQTYIGSINTPEYTAKVESGIFPVYCPSPYFCPSQGYINWDIDRTATINAFNMRQSLATVGETEDMFIYYKGVATY
jgi:hypothetical protein